MKPVETAAAKQTRLLIHQVPSTGARPPTLQPDEVPMDAPQSEEEDVDLGFDPLDVVEHVLSAENLTFDRTEDGDLAFALAGDWKDYGSPGDPRPTACSCACRWTCRPAARAGARPTSCWR